MFNKAFAHLRGRVFGVAPTDPLVTEEFPTVHLSHKKRDWNKLQHPNLEMVKFISSKLKSIVPGADGISSMAWKYGGQDLAQNILALIDGAGSSLPR